MNPQGENLQKEGPSTGQAQPVVRVPQVSETEIEEIPPLDEVANPQQHVRTPSARSHESSDSAPTPPPEQGNSFFSLLWWLVLHLWALALALLTGVQQLVDVYCVLSPPLTQARFSKRRHKGYATVDSIQHNRLSKLLLKYIGRTKISRNFSNG